jgi:RND family efflux transporter MFP subunit
MNLSRLKKITWFLVVFALLVLLGWKIYAQLNKPESGKKKQSADLPVPVQVAAVETGSLQLVRRFTGTLDANAEFIVSPKVSGRVKTIYVDLADRVIRGQLVVELDDAEHRQDVAQAEAQLAVARANHSEARNLLTIAERELKRIEKLSKTGVSSESQRDAASAEQLVKNALVNVTRAQITKAEAELESARIRLDETMIRADWQSGNEQRMVAERYVDEGETVSANAPLLRIVELDPLIAVLHVTERDYARLKVGQQASLSTDAFPGEKFDGTITRIAPVFAESTRQARVELQIINSDLRLKPGMFMRADVVLEQVENTTVVPDMALAKRDGGEGVFMLDVEGKTVSWLPVVVGIRQGDKVQVTADKLQGQVVILGHQMLKQGSSIKVDE